MSRKGQLLLNRRQLGITLGGSLAALSLVGVRGAFAADKVTVAAVYDVPVEQQWVNRIHLALNAAQTRGDINYVFSESVANTDYERVMREYAQAGKQLIIGYVFGRERSGRSVAADYPKQAFLMGSSLAPTAPNFSIFDNWIQETSYLTGMIAGGMTKSNIIGMVAGYPIPSNNRLMNAFAAGVLEVNPKAKFLVNFIGSWFDPPKAKEAAFAQIDRGADVMYAERFGVSDAAKERGVLAIGNVIDTQPDYPNTVVASAIWNMQPTIDHAIEKVRAGNFTAEDYAQYSMLKFGGTSLAPYGTFDSKIPADLKQLVAKRQADMASGSFVVKIDEVEPKTNA